MNAEISYPNTHKASVESLSFNSSPRNMVNIPLKTHGFFILIDHAFISGKFLSSVYSRCKSFAFSALGLRGILTACMNFPLKCQLLTSQSFHLFYLLMWDLNKYVEHLKFLPFLCFLRNKSHAYCTIFFMFITYHGMRKKLIGVGMLYVSWCYKSQGY